MYISKEEFYLISIVAAFLHHIDSVEQDLEKHNKDLKDDIIIFAEVEYLEKQKKKRRIFLCCYVRKRKTYKLRYCEKRWKGYQKRRKWRYVVTRQ